MINYLYACVLIRIKQIHYHIMNLYFLCHITVGNQSLGVLYLAHVICLFMCVFHVLPATSKSSDYILEAVINVTNLELLRVLKSTLSFPVKINDTLQINSINFTTGNSSVLLYC